MLLQSDSFESIDLNTLLNANGWQNRYRIIMGWSKVISVKPPLRVEEYAVHGCDAAVWLKHELNESSVHHFYFDSDSRIIKGLVAMILVHVHGKNTEDIQLPLLEQQIELAGLNRHLSASRANGFARIFNQIKEQLALKESQAF